MVVACNKVRQWVTGGNMQQISYIRSFLQAHAALFGECKYYVYMLIVTPQMEQHVPKGECYTVWQPTLIYNHLHLFCYVLFKFKNLVATTNMYVDMYVL